VLRVGTSGFASLALENARLYASAQQVLARRRRAEDEVLVTGTTAPGGIRVYS
jgi:GAF domain-containing protein